MDEPTTKQTLAALYPVTEADILIAAAILGRLATEPGLPPGEREEIRRAADAFNQLRGRLWRGVPGDANG